MSDSKLARRGKQAVGLLAGVALVGGSLAVVASSASAAIVKTPVDLAGSTETGVTSVSRTEPVVATEGIHNLSATPVTGKMVITVKYATEYDITVDDGLTCGATVPTTTGFTQTCTGLVGAGESLYADLSLLPPTDALLRSMIVSNAITIVNPAPAIYMDPVMVNNHSRVAMKVVDNVDLSTVISAPASVDRLELESGSVSISNAGPDAVYAKLKLTVKNADEFSFVSPAELSCSAAVPNVYNTAYTRTCTTIDPIPSGATYWVSTNLLPRNIVKTLTITATVTKVGATVADSNPLNNKAVKVVGIRDGGPPVG